MSSKSCDEIKALLARFYDGMTIEAEDARLRELLGDENLPDDLKAERTFFEAFSGVRETEIPDGLEERLSAAIDSRADAVRYKTPKVKILSLRRIIGVAASVAIVLATGYGLNHRKESRMLADQAEACATTEKALSIFASAINRSAEGVETAEHLSGQAFALAMGQVNNSLNN